MHATNSNFAFFVEKGMLCKKKEDFDPNKETWPNNVMVEIGPVRLKVRATQAIVIADYPKIYWDREVFLKLISDPSCDEMKFLSQASNVKFVATDTWGAEDYAYKYNMTYYDFFYSPVDYFIWRRTKNSGVKFIGIAYRPI